MLPPQSVQPTLAMTVHIMTWAPKAATKDVLRGGQQVGAGLVLPVSPRRDVTPLMCALDSQVLLPACATAAVGSSHACPEFLPVLQHCSHVMLQAEVVPCMKAISTTTTAAAHVTEMTFLDLPDDGHMLCSREGQVGSRLSAGVHLCSPACSADSELLMHPLHAVCAHVPASMHDSALLTCPWLAATRRSPAPQVAGRTTPSTDSGGSFLVPQEVAARLFKHPNRQAAVDRCPALLASQLLCCAHDHS